MNTIAATPEDSNYATILASMAAPEHGTSQRKNEAMFRRRLLRWFQQFQRTLPWRGETDPYRILVSEIMLQQTRVAVVEDRYRKFLAQFPSVERLARAREETVLAAWSGLGYYRRARALHQAAKEIVARGAFPAAADELRELPGIGRYTAAAVASIAFGEPVAVVDGNVKRVLERVKYRQIPAKQMAEQDYWQAAGRLLDTRHPGDFNQAMMELGALVCLPAQPLCHACPVAALCSSRGPTEKIKGPQRRKAVLQYALARRNGSVLLRQRDRESSLMPGMWELPEITPGKRNETPLLTLRHSITTTDYSVFVFTTQTATTAGRWVPVHAAERLPLTGLTRKILRKLSAHD
ncbi:MAG TPA: A/G-specific adenine glycosylase [Candidatus Angelobacter sp.]|nr:A/G-specific adenine glycosylase [Candidatus Angelobacter sp.]